MQHGWIKLHRKIQDHWVYKEKRTFSKYEAWLDLIFMANHKQNKALIDGELVTIERGQFITSIRKLCDKWSWSNTKVNNFLNVLESDGMITKESDTKKTVISLANYGIYHDNESEKTSQEHHANDTENHNIVNSLESDPKTNDTKKTGQTIGIVGVSEERENEKHHRGDTETSQKHHRDTQTRMYKNVKNVKKKDYTSKIKDLLPVFSPIKNFVELNKRYWDVIRETRKTGNVSKSVIYKTMVKWKKYDFAVVEYALKAHIDFHAGKKEEYTIGIMRNTSKEEALDSMNRKTLIKSSKVVPMRREEQYDDYDYGF